MNEKEIVTFKAIVCNHTVLIRALLLSSAVVLASTYAQPELSAAFTSFTSNFAAVAKGWLWSIGIVLLLVLAWGARWLEGFAVQSWYLNVRLQFAPAAALLAGTYLICRAFGLPGECVPPFMPGTVLFMALTRIWWEDEAPPSKIDDHFQRRYFVERLFEVFTAPYTRLKRIAIIGSWGSGKSTVLHLLRQKLEAANARVGSEPQKDENARPFRMAFVNPWSAATPEEARSIITSGFAAALGLQPSFADGWRVFSWLSMLTGAKIPLAHNIGLDLNRLFEAKSSDEEDELVRRINDELGSRHKTFVILVDDMERAEPEIIRKLFPFIDKLKAIEHCFLVFAIDPERIAKAFREEGRSHPETKGYLDKVFQLQLELPAPRIEDVIKMCDEWVRSSNATPKLRLAFEKIKQHLPTNPREIVHFLDDAATKEALFLNRYRDDEHDYVFFYLFRLLELGCPGISTEFGTEELNGYRSSIYLSVMPNSSGGKEAEEAFKAYWSKIADNYCLSSSDSRRLKKVFENLISDEKKLAWAITGHMRMLTPSADERVALTEYWREHAGTQSFKSMVDDFLPKKSFSDWREAAKELISEELERYGELRSQIGGTSSLSGIDAAEEAGVIVSKLSEHLEFSRQLPNSFDFSQFGEAMFEQWLKIIVRKGPNRSIGINAELVTAEQGFHLSLVDGLPFSILFQYADFTPQNFIDRCSSPLESMDIIEPYLLRLKKKLSLTVGDAVLGWIEEGVFDSSFNKAGLRQDDLYKLGSDPSVWIPSDPVESGRMLAKVGDLAHNTPLASAVFLKMAQIILHHLNSGFAKVVNESDASVMTFFDANGAYFRCIWDAASKCDSNPGLSLVVLQLRRTMENFASVVDGLSVEKIKSTFPLGSWSQHLPPIWP